VRNIPPKTFYTVPSTANPDKYATHNLSLHVELIQRNTAVYVLIVGWVNAGKSRWFGFYVFVF
jgi:hypothetical protein